MVHTSLVRPSTLSTRLEIIMKHLRQIFPGFLLVLALSFPAFAGDIHIPGRTGDVQAPALICVAGDISCPGIAGPQESPGVNGNISTPGIAGDILTPGVRLIFAALFW